MNESKGWGINESGSGWTCSLCGVWVPIGMSHSCKTVEPIDVTYAASVVLHRHRWVYDGMPTVGTYLYHCDEHDPPVIRTVQETPR